MRFASYNFCQNACVCKTSQAILAKHSPSFVSLGFLVTTGTSRARQPLAHLASTLGWTHQPAAFNR